MSVNGPKKFAVKALSHRERERDRILGNLVRERERERESNKSLVLRRAKEKHLKLVLTPKTERERKREKGVTVFFRWPP